LKIPWIKLSVFLLILIGVGIAFYLVPRKRPLEFYTKRAEEAFQSKNFNPSIELYLKALKLYPQQDHTPEILLTIGDIYNFSLGNVDKAGKAYDMLTSRFPHSSEAKKGFEHSAEMYEKNSQYEQALLSYQGVIDNFPDANNLDEIRFKVATMALKLKKYKPARLALMAIVEKNPETPIADRVLYQLGNTFFMEGGMREAVQVLKVAVEKFPNSPLNTEMQFTMANAYEELGQFEDALKIYKTIQPLYPNPKVIENKIEKISQRSTEANDKRNKILEQAKKSNPSLQNLTLPKGRSAPTTKKGHYLDALPEDLSFPE